MLGLSRSGGSAVIVVRLLCIWVFRLGPVQPLLFGFLRWRSSFIRMITIVFSCGAFSLWRVSRRSLLSNRVFLISPRRPCLVQSRHMRRKKVFQSRTTRRNARPLTRRELGVQQSREDGSVSTAERYLHLEGSQGNGGAQASRGQRCALARCRSLVGASCCCCCCCCCCCTDGVVVAATALGSRCR